MEQSAKETLPSLAVTTVRSIRQPVGSLSGGQRQSVAIAKAVLWNSQLVIMDEPTAALGVNQTRMVLDLVRRLADRGLAVLIVSHNLNDVFEVADRIAVLHLGRMVAVRPAERVRPQSVVDYMTSGRSDAGPDDAGLDDDPRRRRLTMSRRDPPRRLTTRKRLPTRRPPASAVPPAGGRATRSASTSAPLIRGCGAAKPACCPSSSACS